MRQLAIEDVQVAFRRRAMLRQCKKNPENSFPQFEGTAKNRPCFHRHSICFLAQGFSSGMGPQMGLLSPASQIKIAMQRFPCMYAALATDGIAKIDAKFAADKVPFGFVNWSVADHIPNVTFKIVFDKLHLTALL